MTWIKICGITNLEDALMAVDAGADALGFVFYEKSPRKVDPVITRRIIDGIASDIESVGVFVGGLNEHSVEIANSTRLNSMQVYDSGNVAEEIFTPLVARIYPCLPMPAMFSDQNLWERMRRGFLKRAEGKSSGDSPLGTVFLDSSTVDSPGGTGKTFDWQKARPWVDLMRKTVNIVVAGGLTSENVGQAMRTLKPWGVDVSSGVEARPGKKDPEKVRAFIAAVREADRKA